MTIGKRKLNWTFSHTHSVHCFGFTYIYKLNNSCGKYQLYWMVTIDCNHIIMATETFDSMRQNIDLHFFSLRSTFFITKITKNHHLQTEIDFRSIYNLQWKQINKLIENLLGRGRGDGDLTRCRLNQIYTYHLQA